MGKRKVLFPETLGRAHKLENDGQATTVYFDAFANDFMDDPLIGLTGAIAEQLPAAPRDRISQVKQAAARLARPAARIGLAAVSAGATELAGPILDAVIAAGGKEAEKASKEFWRRETGRQLAMQQFRNGLEQLTAPSTEDADDARPLIVVVDELDRCRPDYALSVLETIKHFFAVPRVHFVLGVNLRALEQMVRARYGGEIDAHDYLKRFVTLSMELPEHVDPHGDQQAQIRYLEAMVRQIGVEGSLRSDVSAALTFVMRSRQVSLRDIERILTRLVLLPLDEPWQDYLPGWRTLIVGTVLFQVIEPDVFRKEMHGQLKVDDIHAFYGITADMLDREAGRSEGYDRLAHRLHMEWSFAITGKVEGLANIQSVAERFDSWGETDHSRILPGLMRKYFSTFKQLDG